MNKKYWFYAAIVGIIIFIIYKIVVKNKAVKSDVQKFITGEDKSNPAAASKIMDLAKNNKEELFYQVIIGTPSLYASAGRQASKKGISIDQQIRETAAFMALKENEQT